MTSEFSELEVKVVLARWLAHQSGFDPDEIDPRTKQPVWTSLNPKHLIDWITDAGLTISRSEDRAGEWQTALKAEDELITKCQEIIEHYLRPQGLDMKEAFERLIYALDGPEQRAAQDPARALLASLSKEDG